MALRIPRRGPPREKKKRESCAWMSNVPDRRIDFLLRMTAGVSMKRRFWKKPCVRVRPLSVMAKNCLIFCVHRDFPLSRNRIWTAAGGLGLEMVRRITDSEFGSDLEIENRPGRGLTVRWSLPEKHMRRPYLLFVSDGGTWAIPAYSVRRRGVIDPARVAASGQAYDIGGGLIPIIGSHGTCVRPETVMPYFLEIHHRGRRAALLVDDLVSEEPWNSEELVPADPVGP